MIESIIRGALRQRLVVVVIALALMVSGIFAVKKLSVFAARFVIAAIPP